MVHISPSFCKLAPCHMEKLLGIIVVHLTLLGTTSVPPAHTGQQQKHKQHQIPNGKVKRLYASP